MSDFHDDDDPERLAPHRGTPAGRAYFHARCGGETLVTGGDYLHVCDPFWPCTSTYCCQCAGFAALSEVCWVDTEETIADYRRRLRAATPGLLQAWRCGVGFLAGGALGAAAGLLVAVVAAVPQRRAIVFALVGGLVGAVVCYILGTVLLNRVFGIDYRRMH